MNVVLLTGNLVRDPEKQYTNSGMAVTRFTIAVRRAFGKKTDGGQDADFIRVTCFDKQAENVEKYLTKGSKVGVEARVQTGSYQDKDGKTVYTTEFIASHVEFLDSKRDSDGSGAGYGGGSGSGYGGGPSSGYGGGPGYGSQFGGEADAGIPEAARQASAPMVPPAGFEEIDEEDMPF